MPDAKYWVDRLSLEPHPEGGFFRQTYRSPLVIGQSALPSAFHGARNASTAIFFLLAGSDFSALHRLASDEVWHFYAGNTLLVHAIAPGGDHAVIRMGSNSEAGEQVQYVIPAGHWFGAFLEDTTGYALAGCTVAPGFDFSDFELAQRDRLTAEYPQHRELISRLTRQMREEQPRPRA